MKLYHNPLSGPCRVVRVVASLLDLRLEEETVDLANGENKKPEYLKINPNGKVPTLVDGDFTLWEANSINHYLCSKVRETPLYPKDERKRADIERWQFWQTAHWSPSVTPFVWENYFKKIMNLGPADSNELKKAADNFHRFAHVLDQHVAGREYLCGKELTLADLAVATPLVYRQEGQLPIADYRNLLQWFGRIESLAAWKAANPLKG